MLSIPAMYSVYWHGTGHALPNVLIQPPNWQGCRADIAMLALVVTPTDS